MQFSFINVALGIVALLVNLFEITLIGFCYSMSTIKLVRIFDNGDQFPVFGLLLVIPVILAIPIIFAVVNTQLVSQLAKQRRDVFCRCLAITSLTWVFIGAFCAYLLCIEGSFGRLLTLIVPLSLMFGSALQFWFAFRPKTKTALSNS